MEAACGNFILYEKIQLIFFKVKVALSQLLFLMGQEEDWIFWLVGGWIANEMSRGFLDLRSATLISTRVGKY